MPKAPPTYDDILNHRQWYHRIHLGDGEYTPGKHPIDASHWEALGLPNDLSGQSFLDIGASNGLHSFEAERRGADRVVTTDLWDVEHRYEGFKLVHEYLDSDAQYQQMDVFDISPDSIGTHDIVLMSGLIYHVQDPFQAIKNATSVAQEMVVVESAITPLSSPPLQVWRQNAEEEFSDHPDQTNIWWAPNLSLMEEMLMASGCMATESDYTGYPYQEDTRVPAISYGQVTRETELYSDTDLTTPLNRTLESGMTVQILYQNKNVALVKPGTSWTGEPGWVDSRTITETIDDGGEGLLSTLPRYLVGAVAEIRNRGLLSAYLRAKNTLLDRGRGIARGYID